MHGPIDYIIVSFKDNKFDGSILSSLQDAISKDIIDVLALTVISKDNEGTVTEIDAVNLGDSSIVSFSQSIKQDPSIVTQDDIEEVGDLLLGGFHVVHGLVLEVGREDEVRDGSDGQDKEKDGCGEEKNHATEKSPSCSHSVLPGVER